MHDKITPWRNYVVTCMKPNAKEKKLVLFDIDGTLIRSLFQGQAIQRFVYAIKKVYGVDISVGESTWSGKYNGKGDWWIISNLLKEKGISKETIQNGLDNVGRIFCEYLENLSHGNRIYEAVDDAKRLLSLVISAPHLTTSVLTGNLGSSARWKLSHAGYDEFYTFAIFGHEAEDRIELAKLVFPKAKKYIGVEIDPKNIIVIGDTVHDIRCARAIGARVVAVTTGWNVEKETLRREKPDLLVDSLMDERVLSLLGLS